VERAIERLKDFKVFQGNLPLTLMMKMLIVCGGLCNLLKVVWYPNVDQKVCLNMVKKDQLCGIALKKRN